MGATVGDKHRIAGRQLKEAAVVQAQGRAAAARKWKYAWPGLAAKLIPNTGPAWMAPVLHAAQGACCATAH